MDLLEGTSSARAVAPLPWSQLGRRVAEQAASATRVAIERIAREVPGMVAGAGTVTTPDQVDAVRAAGAQFLVTPGSPDRLLAPQQQANASIVIVDPGPDAEGFRFDVCLHGAHGPVCATDLPPTR